MKPLISVIGPVYNQEKYVMECLESLLSQAGPSVEFIIINDGSTDSSPAICEECLKKYDAQARLFHRENHGLLKTRRYGLEAAEGEYVLFVDSDDRLMPEALSVLTEALGDRAFDIVLFNATSDPKTFQPLFTYPFPDGTTFSENDKYALYSLLCCTDKLNNIWAKCIRRDLFEDEEVYRDIEGISNGEDLYQSLALVDLAQKVLFLDRVLYYYRMNMSSMSRSYNPRHFTSEKKVCARRLRCAEKWSRSGGELVRGAEDWICRIMRDVTRKLFVSDLAWPDIAREMKHLRGDAFYRKYYFAYHRNPDKRDLVLKSPLPVMRLWKAAYTLKSRRL